MGDGELARIVKESTGKHCIVKSLLIGKFKHVCACTHSLESVLGIVVLELDTGEKVVDSGSVGKFVCNDAGTYVTEVSV